MANVVINLDVSDELLQELYSKEVDKLPDDVLQDISVNAMKECAGPGLFYTESRKNTWNETPTYIPTRLTNQIISKIDYENYLEPIVATVSEFLRDHFQDLISEYAVKPFASLLFTDATRSDLVEVIYNAFRTQNDRIGR